jgi:hypothetical protein
MGNMDKSTEANNSKTQSAVVAALVIGLLVGFFIGRSWGNAGDDGDVDKKVPMENVENASTTKDSKGAEDKLPGEVVKTEAVSTTDATGEVTVIDQNAGMTVAVSKVTLSNAGWVVVREDTGNGMGNILGALWLPAGTKEGASVELLRTTEAKKNYFVALYTDNGDKKFDKTVDLPIAVDGKVISGIFSAK